MKAGVKHLAIRYILGRAGKGKSHHILHEIERSLQDRGEDRLILLVPEQFTLQSERDLIEKLKLPGIMRVEVLSFTRLAQRVFNEVGGLTRTLLNEQGKNMVLRKMIDEVAEGLTIYKKAAQQDGFVSKFSELLSELKQQDILPAQLLASMEGEEELIIKHPSGTPDAPGRSPILLHPSGTPDVRGCSPILLHPSGTPDAPGGR